MPAVNPSAFRLPAIFLASVRFLGRLSLSLPFVLPFLLSQARPFSNGILVIVPGIISHEFLRQAIPILKRFPIFLVNGV
jgi:hypothetical protein